MDNNTATILEQKFQLLQNKFLDIKKEITLLKQLQEENADLKSQLAAALLEIEQLKIQHKTLTITNTSVATHQQPASSSSIMDSQWASVVRSNIPQQIQQQQVNQKTQKNKQNQKNTKNKNTTNQTYPPSAKMLEWAYLGFTEASGPTGYQFIHFKSSTRTNQRTVRKRLAIIGISNRRVLAVQFPTKGVISLLVHNAYAEEIKASLARGKVTPMAFDPHHESVICDPAHANLSIPQKKQMATDIYYNRMLKLCSTIKPAHVGSSIIRYFHQTQNLFSLPDHIVEKFYTSCADSQQTTDTSAQPSQQQLTTTTPNNLDFEGLCEDDFLSDAEGEQEQ
ncbi:hypothetical protein MAM1_0859d11305 [Mucor ambiguus]|uniref:Uncharacterized protein n=1 Tax=Mucor ambiguus TaxID=91626 RepID=A0A0C9N6P1_9FUNG|nr:hypothetical protein MAM1_0859d11305 [Mucor ambiguus]